MRSKVADHSPSPENSRKHDYEAPVKCKRETASIVADPIQLNLAPRSTNKAQSARNTTISLMFAYLCQVGLRNHDNNITRNADDPVQTMAKCMNSTAKITKTSKAPKI